ncbi:ATP-binding cassette domain-containing protein [Advenella mimigardefordensis]|uniref:Aliphatic sulfonates import ATP-binding protein SsuB n=1 Tax=Advenella mimigardefordensis (strain DSM 17166 / LMG 22922 / DPN7) TaxID=1247726 RepID=W0PA26_ADVMD|nr:ATP-binding cassette domain-containing protein [Advenella mimigardefordensis]AHG62255.1 aliphatic sulfonates import ATP-binding protein SsuB [Advenella mimigardefordensis DPN7]
MEQENGGVAIRLEGAGKRFGTRTVLQGVNLSVAAGEFLSVVGRSGSGKSTLLRLLAGLDTASVGRIRVDGKAAAQSRDDIRIMYQDARLLPWQTVADNVALGLKGKGSQVRKVALEALEQVGLSDRADEWPSVLSGGQRQRVALARALAHRPRLLLLDEPLGALDALTRIEMQALIESLWRDHQFTAVLVTHDVAEAVALADRVILIDQHTISYDLDVQLARPRLRGDADYAALEGQLLSRLLGKSEPHHQSQAA